MSLTDHLRVITANWWRILLIGIVVGALTYGYSKSQPKVYASSALLNIVPGLGNTNTQNLTADELAFRAQFYGTIGTSKANASAAAKCANLNWSPDEAASHLSNVTNQVSGFILLRGTAGSARDAQKFTNCAVEQLQKFVNDDQTNQKNLQVASLNNQLQLLRARLAQAGHDPNLVPVLQAAINGTLTSIIDVQSSNQFAISEVVPAGLSPSPVAPTPARDATLAFLVAAIIAAESFVIARSFGDRFARAQDASAISEFTGLPVLAMIPRGRGPDVVEAFRTLRTNLLFLEGAGRPRTVALVSPNPGAGKSFCAIHLAESAVAVDAEVVLVDADLRRPVIHSRVRIPREPGLSDALRGADMHSTIHCVEGIPNLKVMPSGSPVSDTVGVLGGRAFRGVLDALDTAELVVVDTPPGAVYADALAVSAQCDATLLVLDAKTTRRRAARQMIDSLERTGATLIGAVVNNASYSRRDTYERG
jgi:capsular exopolysaccharide synthesis family protein